MTGKRLDRLRRFAAAYVATLHIADAVRAAGYSAKAAPSTGTKLLQEPFVQAEIQRLQAAKLARAELTADRVLEEYRRLGFSNVQHLLDADGNLRPLHELPAEVAAAISSVEVVMKNAAAGDGKIDRVLKIRLWDKTRTLNDLARHFALLVDRVEISGDVSLTAKIAAARQRGAQLLAERNGEPAS
jgi:phage terminase small subunit